MDDDFDLEQIKEYLATFHSPEDLVILLEIGNEELLNMFEDHLIEHLHKFRGDL